MISFQITPLSVLICHCIAGLGTPFAVAVKLIFLFSHTVALIGFNVILGKVFTVIAIVFETTVSPPAQAPPPFVLVTTQ